MKSVIIYSGGLDSTVLLHQYKDEIGLAVSFDYGSKHNEMEIGFARKNCQKLNIPHLIIPLSFFSHFKSSLLKSGGEIPTGNYANDNMKSTVVPFRNGIMLSIAAGIAESNEMNAVLIANHDGDHSIYPDCRTEFIHAIDEAVRLGTYADVRVVSPYSDRSKRDIALIGRELGVDFSDTYSCYKGGEVHCGLCSTCIERKEALEDFDPTNYAKK
jgi:7-cyano-7-deazaguanine synthase